MQIASKAGEVMRVFSCLSGPKSCMTYVACRREKGSVREARALRVRSLREPVWCRPGSADHSVLRDTFVGNYHQPPRAMRVGATIVDLGANVGYVAADLATRHPGARVVCVELDSGNAAMLRRNLAAFGDRVEVVEGAVWECDGTVRYGGGWQDGFHVVPEVDGGQEAGVGGVGVPRMVGTARALRMETLFREAKIDSVGYCKMDIEGAEDRVLRGDVGWLDAVEQIKVEVHPPCTLEWCMDVFRARGFDVARDPRHWACVTGVRPG